MARYCKLISMLIVSMQIGSTALAQTAEPEWLDELRFQLLADEDCTAAYFLNFRENQGVTGEAVSARVKCVDGRHFDATRPDATSDFTFETCAQMTCELEIEGISKT